MSGERRTPSDGGPADCTVRAATHSDVDAIREVASEAWTAAYDDVLDRSTIEAALAEWYDPAALRELVTADDVAVFVAATDGNGAETRGEGDDGGPDSDVVGYVSAGPDGQPDADASEAAPARRSETATVGALYVLPDLWGEGIGTALLERFLSRTRDRGCAAVEVVALSENDVGCSFYRRRGFATIEERETELFGETVAETVFRRSVE